MGAFEHYAVAVDGVVDMSRSVGAGKCHIRGSGVAFALVAQAQRGPCRWLELRAVGAFADCDFRGDFGLGGEVDGECEFVGTTVAVGVVNLPRDVGAVNLYRREGERLPQNIPFTGSVTPTALRGAAEGLATVTSELCRGV